MKTVSLAEALRSGKNFQINAKGFSPGKIINVKNDFTKSVVWSTETILTAECQIIEEPREIWVWDFGSRFGSLLAENKDRIFDLYGGNTGRPVKFREVCDE